MSVYFRLVNNRVSQLHAENNHKRLERNKEYGGQVSTTVESLIVCFLENTIYCEPDVRMQFFVLLCDAILLIGKVTLTTYSDMIELRPAAVVSTRALPIYHLSAGDWTQNCDNHKTSVHTS